MAQLVELGGGVWGLVAQWWTVASPRSFSAMSGALVTPASEGKGKVR
jgi:hypothetical protein